MFLVAPHQLTEMTLTIRQTAEDDLDDKMRAILDDQSLSSYEKKKSMMLYLNVLTLLKQGDMERIRSSASADSSNSTNSSQPTPPPQDKAKDQLDAVAGETLESLPARVHVKGSHMLDLLKHSTSSFKKPQHVPLGWSSFLHLLADLNTPSSMIHNKHARQQYQRLKSGLFKEGEEEEEEKKESAAEKRRTKKKMVLSPQWINFSP